MNALPQRKLNPLAAKPPRPAAGAGARQREATVSADKRRMRNALVLEAIAAGRTQPHGLL